jgi:hypothetical protein
MPPVAAPALALDEPPVEPEVLPPVLAVVDAPAELEPARAPGSDAVVPLAPSTLATDWWSVPQASIVRIGTQKVTSSWRMMNASLPRV